MLVRLTTLCHLWPGVTPWTVWDLTLDQWVLFARSTDNYRRDMAQQSNSEPGRPAGPMPGGGRSIRAGRSTGA